MKTEQHKPIDTPFQWFGGNAEFAQSLIDLFPPHHTFVDACGGSGSMILAKPPSPVDVYNNIDGRLVNFFRQCRDNPEELAGQLMMTPYARAEYDAGKIESPDPIEDARRFAAVARQSVGGAWGRSWSRVVTHSRRGMASGNSRWLHLPDAVLQIAARFASVQIENLDVFKLIDDYDTPSTLFYFDPPYHPDTRTPDVYRFETDASWHTRFLARVAAIEGFAIVSGYDHPEYNEALASWQRRELVVSCRSNVRADGSTSKRATRTEVVWLKGPSCP